MGNKVPWKTGMLIYLLVTSRPLISCRKNQFYHLVSVLRPPNLSAMHSVIFISQLNFATHETEDPFATPHLGLPELFLFKWYGSYNSTEYVRDLASVGHSAQGQGRKSTFQTQRLHQEIGMPESTCSGGLLGGVLRGNTIRGNMA